MYQDEMRCKKCEDANDPAKLRAEIDALRKQNAKNEDDAVRYRWLRAQHWNEAPLCVVARPKDAVKLGHNCPSLDRLDTMIDDAMKTPNFDIGRSFAP